MTRNEFKSVLIATHGVIAPAKMAQLLGENGSTAQSIVQQAVKKGELVGLGQGFQSHRPRRTSATLTFKSVRA